MGGDEFVMLLEGSPTAADTTVVVTHILAAMHAPIALAGLALAIKPSIGVAYFPEHGTDEASLLRRADEAMYQAKSASARQRCSSAPPVDTLLDKDQG